MKILYSIDNLDIKNAVITIGTFDGLHKGHLRIIEKLKLSANKINGESVVLTFNPHPRQIIFPNENIFFLNTIQEKINLLKKAGIDNLIILPFSKEFSQQTSCEFIENILYKKLKTKHLIVGYDHRFGKDRQGNLKVLQACASNYNFDVEKVDVFTLNDINISSTKIRNAIIDGKIELANKFLGYNYLLEGKVIKGNKIGRTIGFPTANISLFDDKKLIPRNGVYAVKVFIENQEYIGMLNIGTNPTVNNSNKISIEVNIFNFEDELYEKYLKIEFIEFIREEIKFNTLTQLKKQIVKDKTLILKYIPN